MHAVIPEMVTERVWNTREHISLLLAAPKKNKTLCPLCLIAYIWDQRFQKNELRLQDLRLKSTSHIHGVPSHSWDFVGTGSAGRSMCTRECLHCKYNLKRKTTIKNPLSWRALTNTTYVFEKVLTERNADADGAQPHVDVLCVPLVGVPRQCKSRAPRERRTLWKRGAVVATSMWIRKSKLKVEQCT